MNVYARCIQTVNVNKITKTCTSDDMIDEKYTSKQLNFVYKFKYMSINKRMKIIRQKKKNANRSYTFVFMDRVLTSVRYIKKNDDLCCPWFSSTERRRNLYCEINSLRLSFSQSIDFNCHA